ncbi:MAG: Rieske (2Fe-2S) protein [Halothiobacillaceae bacterium]
MSDWIDVDAAEAIGPGEHRVVETDDGDILVVNDDGEFFAIEDLCSHQALPLAGGPVADGTITCPWHGAEFCLKSGAALAAPAYEDIHSFPVRTEAGRVQVRDDRFD